MARDLATVIDQLLAVIPRDERMVRARLLAVAQRVAYTAPKLRHRNWSAVASILWSDVGDPSDREWAKRVAAIFAGDVGTTGDES